MSRPASMSVRRRLTPQFMSFGSSFPDPKTLHCLLPRIMVSIGEDITALERPMASPCSNSARGQGKRLADGTAPSRREQCQSWMHRVGMAVSRNTLRREYESSKKRGRQEARDGCGRTPGALRRVHVRPGMPKGSSI